jgi:hypothetical protein
VLNSGFTRFYSDAGGWSPAYCHDRPCPGEASADQVRLVLDRVQTALDHLEKVAGIDDDEAHNVSAVQARSVQPGAGLPGDGAGDGADQGAAGEPLCL